MGIGKRMDADVIDQTYHSVILILVQRSLEKDINISLPPGQVLVKKIVNLLVSQATSIRNANFVDVNYAPCRLLGKYSVTAANGWVSG
jgi:hypothetical protein